MLKKVLIKNITKSALLEGQGDSGYTFNSPLKETKKVVSIENGFINKVNESINETKANELIFNAINGIDLSQIETNKNDISNIKQEQITQNGLIETNKQSINTIKQEQTIINQKVDKNKELTSEIIDGLKILRTFDYKGDYVSGNVYELNDVVSLNNNLYLSKQDNNNHTPPNDTYWLIINSMKGDINLSNYYTKLEVDNKLQEYLLIATYQENMTQLQNLINNKLDKEKWESTFNILPSSILSCLRGINMNNATIFNVKEPTQDNQVATKAYVDSKVSSGGGNYTSPNDNIIIDNDEKTIKLNNNLHLGYIKLIGANDRYGCELSGYGSLSVYHKDQGISFNVSQNGVVYSHRDYGFFSVQGGELIAGVPDNERVRYLFKPNDPDCPAKLKDINNISNEESRYGSINVDGQNRALYIKYFKGRFTNFKETLLTNVLSLVDYSMFVQMPNISGGWFDVNSNYWLKQDVNVEVRLIENNRNIEIWAKAGGNYKGYIIYYKN